MSKSAEKFPNQTLELITRLSEITDSDIAATREKIIPKCLDEFDALNHEIKIRLALFNQMSSKELQQLAKAEYLPGLHNIKTELTKYYLLTNQKYGESTDKQ